MDVVIDYTQITVLFSELFAIKQALHYIELYTEESFVIFCDSRSALQLIVSNSSMYEDIIAEIKNKLLLLNEDRQVLLHWVRGHGNVRGNEVVDTLAKKGTRDTKSVNCYLTREEINSCLTSKFLDYWDKQWKFSVQMSGKGLDLFRIRTGIRQKVPVYKLKNKLQEKAIYRLRLGHAGVKKYLCRVNMVDNAICDFCKENVEETVEHYLLYCNAYDIQRKCMYSSLQKLNVKEINVKVLLGGDGKYSMIIRNILRILAKFLAETNRITDM